MNRRTSLLARIEAANKLLAKPDLPAKERARIAKLKWLNKVDLKLTERDGSQQAVAVG